VRVRAVCVRVRDLSAFLRDVRSDVGVFIRVCAARGMDVCMRVVCVVVVRNTGVRVRECVRDCCGESDAVGLVVEREELAGHVDGLGCIVIGRVVGDMPVMCVRVCVCVCVCVCVFIVVSAGYISKQE